MAQAGPLWSTLSEGATTAALFRTAQDLAAVLAITVLAVGAGSLLLQLILRGRVIGHLERWSFGAALGLGLLAHAFFLLGLAGGLRPLPAWLLLAVFAALALAGYIRWPWPPWSRAPARHDEPPLGLLPRVVQGFLLIALLLTLTRALAPPVAWDSHVNHLTAPLQNLEQGKITAGMDVPHFYFPALVEQLYTLGLLLRGDTVAQPLHLVLAAVGFPRALRIPAAAPRRARRLAGGRHTRIVHQPVVAGRLRLRRVGPPGVLHPCFLGAPQRARPGARVVAPRLRHLLGPRPGRQVHCGLRGAGVGELPPLDNHQA